MNMLKFLLQIEQIRAKCKLKSLTRNIIREIMGLQELEWSATGSKSESSTATEWDKTKTKPPLQVQPCEWCWSVELCLSSISRIAAAFIPSNFTFFLDFLRFNFTIILFQFSFLALAYFNARVVLLVSDICQLILCFLEMIIDSYYFLLWLILLLYLFILLISLNLNNQYLIGL